VGGVLRGAGAIVRGRVGGVPPRLPPDRLSIKGPYTGYVFVDLDPLCVESLSQRTTGNAARLDLFVRLLRVDKLPAGLAVRLEVAGEFRTAVPTWRTGRFWGQRRWGARDSIAKMSAAWIAVIGTLGGVVAGGATNIVLERMRWTRDDRTAERQRAEARVDRRRDRCIEFSALADEIRSRLWSFVDYRLADPEGWRTDD
jgi:hypothetical protein